MRKNRPETMAEAIQFCFIKIPLKTLEELEIKPEEEMFECHFGLGMWLRNSLGLWSGGPLLALECVHPDDASMVILDELRKYMKQHPDWRLVRRQLIKGETERKQRKKS